MNRSPRSWLTTGELAKLTGYSGNRLTVLARAEKVPGKRQRVDPPGSRYRCNQYRFDDTPELREWVAAMARRSAMRRKLMQGDQGIDAKKALTKFQIAYARRAPLSTWPLDMLEGLERELGEIVKIHGDICRAIEKSQAQRSVQQVSD